MANGSSSIRRAKCDIAEVKHAIQLAVRDRRKSEQPRRCSKTEADAVSRRERKKVEMLFAHLKRILRLDRLRLRGPSGAKDEFLLAATTQNLRKLAKLIPFRRPYSPHERKGSNRPP